MTSDIPFHIDSLVAASNMALEKSGVRFRLKPFCVTEFLDFEEGDESWPMLKRFGRLNAHGNDGYPDKDYDETGILPEDFIHLSVGKVSSFLPQKDMSIGYRRGRFT